MTPRSPQTPLLSRSTILRIALPIVIANASTPLLGLVDVAVIGHQGSTTALGAIALGSLIFTFVYWTFGFLRMSTTGFVAQAHGAGAPDELRAAAIRATCLGATLGGALCALGWPLRDLALRWVSAGPAVEADAALYFQARLWGAPAALAGFALLGTLLGLGRARQVLVVQLTLNGTNMVLDVLLAGVWGWGAQGIGWGSAAAEWVGALLSAYLVWRQLAAMPGAADDFWQWRRVMDRARWKATFSANFDIMGRTLLLLSGFAWFTARGAHFGDATLAANHVLLQLVSFSAFFLDGYAFSTEVLVGRARGARDTAAFDAAVRGTTELAAFTALLLGAGLTLAGPAVIEQLTDLENVRQLAIRHLDAVACYVVVSVAAFQLDGIFLGATRTRAMLWSSSLALLTFVAAERALTPALGNTGLWWAFVAYVVARGATLGASYSSLRRALTV